MAHPNKTQPPAEAVAAMVTLLTDRACPIAELAALTGLPLSELADMAESDAVQTALTDLRRIARVRHDFLAAEADCIATATLLTLATTTPDSPRAADQARKAATSLRSKPGRTRGQSDAPADPTPTSPRPPHRTPPPGRTPPPASIPGRETTTFAPHSPSPHQHARASTTRPTPAQLRASTGADRPP
jgi:hypothetical protein